MDPDYAQRRRFLIAAAVTLILVPGAFLLNRGGDDTEASPIGTVVGTVPDDTAAADAAPASTPDAASDDDPLGTIPVGYLQGTEVPNTADAPMIAIPRPKDVVEGKASFSHDISVVNQCIIGAAPNSARVTVTNLDNSRSVQCINTLVAVQQPFDVMLSSESFLYIADLTDAPVHVAITW